MVVLGTALRVALGRASTATGNNSLAGHGAQGRIVGIGRSRIRNIERRGRGPSTEMGGRKFRPHRNLEGDQNFWG